MLGNCSHLQGLFPLAIISLTKTGPSSNFRFRHPSSISPHQIDLVKGFNGHMIGVSRGQAWVWLKVHRNTPFCDYSSSQEKTITMIINQIINNPQLFKKTVTINQIINNPQLLNTRNSGCHQRV